MNPQLRPRAVLTVVCLLVLGFVSVSLVWKVGLASATPSAQLATTTPSPSPTPSPPDLALAAQFARQGEIEAAVGAYQSVIEQGTPAERLAARLALARVFLDDGQLALTVRQLDAYLLEAPADADVRPAQYLLAEALALQGDWEGALPLYDAYVQAGGGASLYARQGRAEALARLGRGAAAAREGERLLAEGLPASVRLPFILTMARLLEPSYPQDALVLYDRLRDESEAPADQALALWRSALIRLDLGDGQALGEAWSTVIQRYPNTATARAIVDGPPAGSLGLDRYYTGLVYYRGGRAQEARAALQSSLDANRASGSLSLAARASFYLAVLDEGAGDTEQALAGYGLVVELSSRVELADDALWWRGQLQEQIGRVAGAAESYQRLVSEFAGSGWALEARFRLALFEYDAGDLASAARSFGAAAARSPGEERQRALLWQGKALRAAGDEEAATAVWRSLRQEAPNEYYGLRAAVLLGDASGRLRDAGVAEAHEPDWAAIEAWLLDATGENPAAALETLLYDRHWGVGQELLALGMHRRAGAEFRLLLGQANDEPAVLYQLTRFFRSAGMIDLSSVAATRLLYGISAEVREEAPGDLWRLAYPAPFPKVLRQAADVEETPDVLLLALVRQESFFDPLAGSSAGALGLTQVIAPTGEAIASDLGVEDFEVEDLYRPALSLRFGAHYLREQLDLFDGNIYHALAAYNAGPGNALRWRGDAGDDVDRFFEEIQFSETEAYVRLVSQNLARYRQLYQGLEEPSLPRE